MKRFVEVYDNKDGKRRIDMWRI